VTASRDRPPVDDPAAGDHIEMVEEVDGRAYVVGNDPNE
jgi:hypothetical protein